MPLIPWRDAKYSSLYLFPTSGDIKPRRMTVIKLDVELFAKQEKNLFNVLWNTTFYSYKYLDVCVRM